jgi:hypothetical protein
MAFASLGSGFFQIAAFDCISMDVFFFACALGFTGFGIWKRHWSVVGLGVAATLAGIVFEVRSMLPTSVRGYGVLLLTAGFLLFGIGCLFSFLINPRKHETGDSTEA